MRLRTKNKGAKCGGNDIRCPRLRGCSIIAYGRIAFQCRTMRRGERPGGGSKADSAFIGACAGALLPAACANRKREGGRRPHLTRPPRCRCSRGARQRRDRPHPDGVQVQLANVLRGLRMQSKGIKLNSKSRGGAHATGPASETL